MKQTTNDTKRLEALHRLYYTLAHQVLPEIILSDKVDQLLSPNPAGDGILSEAGAAAIPDTAQQDDPETAPASSQASDDDELQALIGDQEAEQLTIGLFEFEDELTPFGKTTDTADTDGYTLDDELAEDFFGDDSEDDDFDPDAAYNDFDAADEDSFEEEEDEAEKADVDGLLNELESMLELHTLGQVYDNPDEAFLADTWRESWFQTELEDYPASTGYTLRRLNQQGYEIIHFTFPKPVGVTAAWQAIAIRQKGAPYRYFTLEKTVVEDKEEAVLAEWETVDKHKNHGQYTQGTSEADEFLNMVLAKLA